MPLYERCTVFIYSSSTVSLLKLGFRPIPLYERCTEFIYGSSTVSLLKLGIRPMSLPSSIRSSTVNLTLNSNYLLFIIYYYLFLQLVILLRLNFIIKFYFFNKHFDLWPLKFMKLFLLTTAIVKKLFSTYCFRCNFRLQQLLYYCVDLYILS